MEIRRAAMTPVLPKTLPYARYCCRYLMDTILLNSLTSYWRLVSFPSTFLWEKLRLRTKARVSTAVLTLITDVSDRLTSSLIPGPHFSTVTIRLALMLLFSNCNTSIERLLQDELDLVTPPLYSPYPPPLYTSMLSCPQCNLSGPGRKTIFSWPFLENVHFAGLSTTFH